MAALAEMRAELAGEPQPAWGPICMDDRPDCGPWRTRKTPPVPPKVAPLPLSARKRTRRAPSASAARSGRKDPGVASGVWHCVAHCCNVPGNRAPSPCGFDSASAEVDDNFKARLLARLKEVSRVRPDAPFWMIVEVCHDCANHGPSVRHDEAAYRSRFLTLQRMVQESIPSAGCAPLGGTGAGGAARIGAFEVYLCCNTSTCGVDAFNDPGTFPLSDGWMASCIASKLSSRSWPQPEVVLSKLSNAVPRVQLQLRVLNSAGLPIPAVAIEAAAVEFNGVVSKDTTGPNGLGNVLVPLGSTQNLKISREDGVVPDQMRQVAVASAGMAEEFVVERVVKILQCKVEGEEQDELVVYSFSPRAAEQPSHMIPFQGDLEHSEGTLEPDSHGLLRGITANDLEGLEELIACCDAWRSSPVKPVAVRSGDPRELQELARLLPPLLEVSLVSGCCDVALPGALIAIDGKNLGRTVGDGTLQAAIPCGERRVCVQHPLINTSLEQMFTVAGSMSSGLKVSLPTEGMCLVSSVSGKCGTRDVWLVPKNGVDGHRQEAWTGTLAGYPVVDGVLPNPDLDLKSSDCCCWVTLLSKAADKRGVPLALQPKMNSSNCMCGELVRNGAIWVGQETPESFAAASKPTDENVAAGGVTEATVNLTLCTSCCGCGMAEVRGIVDGETSAASGEEGCIRLKHGASRAADQGVFDVELLGAPPLLPTHKFVLNCPQSAYGSPDPLQLEVVVRCAVFAYVCLPEDEDDTGCVSLCAIEQQIPEGAIPVTGKLLCPGTHEKEICLDGSSFGPFTLHADTSLEERSCFIQHLTLETKVNGMDYRARDPSPLLERGNELGGCELQRLAFCPVALGFLEPDGSAPVVAVTPAGGFGASCSAESDMAAALSSSSVGNTRGLPSAVTGCSFDANGEAVSLPPQPPYLPLLPPSPH
eukprot:gnl/MRDRNA2_/MRDRNA2_18227_c0_seq1.p1 gnl/MRDRNA2_/MRDRNA2_18227_c0~~gnl/MRDRNA2_/MRDRNA2_18227_c0_seq1.p1  ORF type:complete len:949 (-),score=165.55 gnl/MRDRNA2_/MRDRNA2_18227_c0_seq1:5-2794(-)